MSATTNWNLRMLRKVLSFDISETKNFHVSLAVCFVMWENDVKKLYEVHVICVMTAVTYATYITNHKSWIFQICVDFYCKSNCSLKFVEKDRHTIFWVVSIHPSIQTLSVYVLWFVVLWKPSIFGLLNENMDMIRTSLNFAGPFPCRSMQA